eukprot:GEMP01000207.1.p1 GENE.GEMP01000207.1~~GEMP01000207.1.p1  ORF type:complete len:1804 (+),score=304.41 GEMP01000207.1:233-5644(+)
MSQSKGPTEPFSELRPKTCYKPEEMWMQLVMELTEADNLYGDDDLLARLAETDDLEGIYSQEVDVEERALYDSQSDVMFRGFREWYMREGLENSVSTCERWDSLSAEERCSILETSGKKEGTQRKGPKGRDAFFPMNYGLRVLYESSKSSQESASRGSSREQRPLNDEGTTLLTVEILDSVPQSYYLSSPTASAESEDDEEMPEGENEEQRQWVSTTAYTPDADDTVMVQRTRSQDAPSFSHNTTSLTPTVLSVPVMSECATHAPSFSALDAVKETASSQNRESNIRPDAAWPHSPHASEMNSPNISSISMLNNGTREKKGAGEHRERYQGADDCSKVDVEFPSPHAPHDRDSQSSLGDDSNASTLILTPDGGIYVKKTRKSLRERVKDLIDAKNAVCSSLLGSSCVDQISSASNLNTIPQKVSTDHDEESNQNTSIDTLPPTNSDEERTGRTQESTVQTDTPPHFINSPTNGISGSSLPDVESTKSFTNIPTSPIFVERFPNVHHEETPRDAHSSPMRLPTGGNCPDSTKPRHDLNDKTEAGESRYRDASEPCMDTKSSTNCNLPCAEVLKLRENCCAWDEKKMATEGSGLNSEKPRGDFPDEREAGENRYSDESELCMDTSRDLRADMLKCGENHKKSSVLNREVTPSGGNNQYTTKPCDDSPGRMEPGDDRHHDTSESCMDAKSSRSGNPCADVLKLSEKKENCSVLNEEETSTASSNQYSTKPCNGSPDRMERGENRYHDVSELCVDTTLSTSGNSSTDVLKLNENNEDCDVLNEENMPLQRNSLHTTELRDDFVAKREGGENRYHDISEPCINTTSSTNRTFPCDDVLKLNEGNKDCGVVDDESSDKNVESTENSSRAVSHDSQHDALASTLDHEVSKHPKTPWCNFADKDSSGLTGMNLHEKKGDDGQLNIAKNFKINNIEDTFPSVDIPPHTTKDDDSKRENDGLGISRRTNVVPQADICGQSNFQPVNEENDMFEPGHIHAANRIIPSLDRDEVVPKSNSSSIPSAHSVDETVLQGCSLPQEEKVVNPRECFSESQNTHSYEQRPRQESTTDTLRVLSPSALSAAKKSPTSVTFCTQSPLHNKDSRMYNNAPSQYQSNIKNLEVNEQSPTPGTVATQKTEELFTHSHREAVLESAIPQTAGHAQLAGRDTPQPENITSQLSFEKYVEQKVALSENENVLHHDMDMGTENERNVGLMASNEPENTTVEPKRDITDHTKAESTRVAKQKVQPAAKRPRAAKKKKTKEKTTTAQGGASSLFIEVDPSELPSSCMLDEEPGVLSPASGDKLPPRSNADADISKTVANRKRPEVEKDTTDDTAHGPKRKRNKTMKNDRTKKSDNTELLLDEIPAILSGESLEDSGIITKQKHAIMRRGRKRSTPITGCSKQRTVATSSTKGDRFDEAVWLEPTHNASNNTEHSFDVNPAVLPSGSLEELGLVAKRKLTPMKRDRNKNNAATERSTQNTAPMSPTEGDRDGEAMRLESKQNVSGNSTKCLLGVSPAVEREDSLKELGVTAKRFLAPTKRDPNKYITMDECSKQKSNPMLSSEGDRGDQTIRLEHKQNMLPRTKKKSRKSTTDVAAASLVTQGCVASIQGSQDDNTQESQCAQLKGNSSMELCGRKVAVLDQFLTHWWHVRGSRHDHSPGRRVTPPPEKLGPLPSDVRAPWIVWYDYYSDAFASDFDDTEHIRLAFLRLPLAIREEFIQVSNWENECFMHFVKEQAGDGGPWCEELLERWNCLDIMEKWQRVRPWGEPRTPVPISFAVEQKQVAHVCVSAKQALCRAEGHNCERARSGYGCE